MSLTKTLTSTQIPGLENYVLEKELNHGYFGRVYMAREMKNNRQWALKFIEKTHLNERQKKNIQREIEIMARARHPNIIQYKESIETPTYFVIVMELMKGGDLFDRLQEQTTFLEEDARVLILQVAEAIQYLHSIGIAHRDLKIENLMFTEKGSSVIKVGDFGLAKQIGKLPTKTPVGTQEYMAPEIVKGEYYSTTVDIWSLGCLVFILLYGTFPFYNETDRRGNRLVDIKEKIKTGYFTFPEEGEYNNEPISENAKDLIRKSLNVDASKRLTIEQFLSHPWMRTRSLRKTPLNAPAALRTADGLVSMREYFNFGVHTERNRLDSDEASMNDPAHVIADQKPHIQLNQVKASDLAKKREAKKLKGLS